MREIMISRPSGREAYQPAGTTLDWSVDETRELSRTSDTINVATVSWALESAATTAGWGLGAIVNTTTQSSVFVTAPATVSNTPYRCTLTYQTTGGRTRIKAFWLRVVDPILFYQ